MTQPERRQVHPRDAQPRAGVTRRRAVLGVLAVPVLGLAGCGGQSVPEGPPEIVYGTTRCEGCAGPITDPKFAAAIVQAPPAGTTFFNDPGAMIDHIQSSDGLAGNAWVHDYDSGEWVDAQKALYVVDSSLPTPANSGVVAFSDKAKANALAEKGGVVQTWAQMLDHWKLDKQP